MFRSIVGWVTVRGSWPDCGEEKNSNSISFPSEKIIARLLDYVCGEIVDRLANRGAKKILYATLYFRNYIYIDVKEHLKYVNLDSCYESYCVL